MEIQRHPVSQTGAVLRVVRSNLWDYKMGLKFCRYRSCRSERFRRCSMRSRDYLQDPTALMANWHPTTPMFPKQHPTAIATIRYPRRWSVEEVRKAPVDRRQSPSYARAE
jgi:hypothetical protein